MIHIREAVPEDLAIIAEFIRKLATYERMEEDIRFEEATLGEHLFGERTSAEVLIAEWEGKPAGFALFYKTFSTFAAQPGVYLEDLFVDQEMRGRNIGLALLSRLAEIAVDRGADRLDWSVLSWNEPAKQFYRKMGAAQQGDQWEHWRLGGDSLYRLSYRFNALMEEQLVDRVAALAAPLGTITKRWRFGHAIDCDGVHFALVDEAGLWFVADEETAPVWDASRCDPWHVRFSDGTDVKLGYRAAPDDALRDGDAFLKWARLALEAGVRRRIADERAAIKPAKLHRMAQRGEAPGQRGNGKNGSR